MRDFDDVSPNLVRIREGHAPDHSDPTQRVADLRSAGLVNTTGTGLSDLGSAVLDAWEKYGVATSDIGDEYARLLLMVLEGRRIGDPGIANFLTYWSDIRTHFDPLELIHNWDALYALTYMDFERAGFRPGAVLRDEAVPAREIEFDLADYARAAGGSTAATRGGEKLERAIGAKVPRGRHRATFCMALETVLSGGLSAPPILQHFGIPKKPASWTALNGTQKAKILEILSNYGAAGGGAGAAAAGTAGAGGWSGAAGAGTAGAGAAAGAAGAGTASAGVGMPAPEVGAAVTAAEATAPPSVPTAAGLSPSPPPMLPPSIDFSTVLVDPPKAKSEAAAKGGSGGGAKKVDHQKKAKANDEVGKLGEDFAVQYERWRLRHKPDLQKKIRHISDEDDTAGYDIESFEEDGTPRYVEVKGTLGPLESRFFLSANELECAKAKGAQYVILRVARLDSAPVCCEIRYPFASLSLVAATYSVTFL